MHGIQMLNDALFEAVKHGTLQEVIQTEMAGAEVNARDEYGCTPLMRAAYRGDMEIIKYLFFRGADANAVNNVGWTALMGAAFKCHKRAVVFLCAMSDPETVFLKDNAGLTALDKAHETNCDAIVDFLTAIEILYSEMM